MRRARLAGLTILLVALGINGAAAQSGPYVNLGWNRSLIGESSYTPGRPEVTFGWMRESPQAGWEVSAAWTYLENDEYRTFWLDERYAAAFAPRNAITDRDEFQSRYHVVEAGARLVFPLVDQLFAGLVGVEKTRIWLGYQDPAGSTRWEAQDDTPRALSYGFRLLFVYGFLEWRGSWAPGGSDWSAWDSVHDHGISFGFSWNPLWDW